MHARITGERCVFALFALCGGYAVVASGSFDPGFGPGAAFVPKTFGAICCIFGAIGVVLAKGAVDAPRVAARDLMLIVAAFALYGLLFVYLGFFWDAVVLAVCLTLAFVRNRSVWLVAGIEILFVMLLHVIFTRLFQVQFPGGLL